MQILAEIYSQVKQIPDLIGASYDIFILWTFMKKIIIWILVFISLIALLFRFSGKIAEALLNIKPKSGISVMSEPLDATVFIDNVEVGKTPYESQNLDPKEYLIRAEKDGMIWQGKVKLREQTLTLVNRELSKDQTFSAGEILSLEEGRGLTVISNPLDATVEVDEKLYGQTPISIDVEPGEHTISVSHANYLKRNIRAIIPPNFNLIVSVELSLSETDLTTISTPVIKTTSEVKILDTPTGFLRVRDKASLSGKEIARVNPGDTLVLLEELSSWVKVRLPDGKEGFVSSTYVERQNP